MLGSERIRIWNQTEVFFDSKMSVSDSLNVSSCSSRKPLSFPGRIVYFCEPLRADNFIFDKFGILTSVLLRRNLIPIMRATNTTVTINSAIVTISAP